MSKFEIKYGGLKEGKFRYGFEIESSFFEKFPESEITQGQIIADIDLTVMKDLLQLDIKLSGTVKLQCDRCLDFFDYKINYDTVLFAEFGNENSDLSDADNKITINSNNEKIVLDKHFYDYIHLSLPYKRVHKDDKNGNSTCNAEMINKIEQYKYSDTETTTDPRWDKLKDLFN